MSFYKQDSDSLRSMPTEDILTYLIELVEHNHEEFVDFMQRQQKILIEGVMSNQDDLIALISTNKKVMSVCSECRCWIQFKEPEDYGRCIRFPPSIPHESNDEQDIRVSVQPITHKKSGCVEAIKREGE